MKDKFINKEIWSLTLRATFLRAKIYKPGITSEVRTEFSNELKAMLDTLIDTKYNTTISEQKHIEIINRVSQSFRNHQAIIKGSFNFGVAQKLLNLYLKYHWCLNKIPTPPHFPVDRVIQKKLKLKVVSWTQMNGEVGIESYINVIEAAKSQLDKHKCNNVAELELKLTL